MAQRCNSSHRKAVKMITLEANSYTLSLTFDIGPVSLTGTGTLPGFLKILNGTNITIERTLE